MGFRNMSPVPPSWCQDYPHFFLFVFHLCSVSHDARQRIRHARKATSLPEDSGKNALGPRWEVDVPEVTQRTALNQPPTTPTPPPPRCSMRRRPQAEAPVTTGSWRPWRAPCPLPPKQLRYSPNLGAQISSSGPCSPRQAEGGRGRSLRQRRKEEPQGTARWAEFPFIDI